jgi:hypothetical protein
VHRRGGRQSGLRGHREMIHVMWNSHYAEISPGILPEWRSRMDPVSVAGVEDGRATAPNSTWRCAGGSSPHRTPSRACSTRTISAHAVGVRRRRSRWVGSTRRIFRSTSGLVPVGRVQLPLQLHRSARRIAPGRFAPNGMPVGLQMSDVAAPISACSRRRPRSSRRGRGPPVDQRWSDIRSGCRRSATRRIVTGGGLRGYAERKHFREPRRQVGDLLAQTEVRHRVLVPLDAISLREETVARARDRGSTANGSCAPWAMKIGTSRFAALASAATLSVSGRKLDSDRRTRRSRTDCGGRLQRHCATCENPAKRIRPAESPRVFSRSINASMSRCSRTPLRVLAPGPRRDP